MSANIRLTTPLSPEECSSRLRPLIDPLTIEPGTVFPFPIAVVDADMGSVFLRLRPTPGKTQLLHWTLRARLKPRSSATSPGPGTLISARVESVLPAWWWIVAFYAFQLLGYLVFKFGPAGLGNLSHGSTAWIAFIAIVVVFNAGIGLIFRRSRQALLRRDPGAPARLSAFLAQTLSASPSP